MLCRKGECPIVSGEIDKESARGDSREVKTATVEDSALMHRKGDELLCCVGKENAR